MEMKGNGQSIWSKMDREQSNVTHGSSALAVRFLAMLFPRLAASAKHMQLMCMMRCQLASFVMPAALIVVSLVGSSQHGSVRSSRHGSCGCLSLHQSKIVSVVFVQTPKWPCTIPKQAPIQPQSRLSSLQHLKNNDSF